MSSPESLLSVLATGAVKYATRPALKVPSSSPELGLTWEDVTYEKLHADVEACARHWVAESDTHGWKPGAVIGLWLAGIGYLDLITLLGVSRAGLVPQLLSLRLPDPGVILELLIKSSAAAVVVEPSLKALVTECPFAVYTRPDTIDWSIGDRTINLPSLPAELDQVVMIYHTSGTTSGRPKLVPYTARFINLSVQRVRDSTWNRSPGQVEVAPICGSFCHAAAFQLLLRSLACGGCSVLPTSLPLSLTEVQQMIRQCRFTSLTLFGSILAKLIEAAQRDPLLLAELQKLGMVTSTGLSLDEELAEWALEQGIRLMTVFASTEVGASMISRDRGPKGFLFKPYPGTLPEFYPVEGREGSDEHLVELVVPPEAPQCPHTSLRSVADGKFHTGDLFEEVSTGKYIYRGRNDDWIKMENSLKCDTVAIEGKAIELCGQDLVDTAVVVGTGRPSPVLIVEPKVAMAGTIEEEALKEEILKRILPFSTIGYLHERISEVSRILVAPPGSLPRTGVKGNIRRAATEDVYKARLDKIFSQ